MNKNIRIRSIISEKSTGLASLGWYSFNVPVNISKKEAKASIENNFKVKVVKTNSTMKKGKIRRSGKNFGKTKAYKKIFVRLKKGQTINIFEVEK